MRRTPETSFHHYPHAMAMCDCDPTHTWGGRRLHQRSSCHHGGG